MLGATVAIPQLFFLYSFSLSNYSTCNHAPPFLALALALALHFKCFQSSVGSSYSGMNFILYVVVFNTLDAFIGFNY